MAKRTHTQAAPTTPDSEWFSPKPLEERSSQHVKPADFIDWVGKIAAAGLLTGGALWAGAKLFKPKIAMPKMMQKAGEPFGFWQDAHMAPSTYFGLGTKMGIVARTFTLWRGDKAQFLGVDDIAQALPALQHAIPTQQQVQEDNALVGQMIVHEKEKQVPLAQALLAQQPMPHHIAAAQHQGAVQAYSPELHVSSPS